MIINHQHYHYPNNYAAHVETCMQLNLHLHVAGSSLQNPVDSHVLLFEPISIYPSGQT